MALVSGFAGDREIVTVLTAGGVVGLPTDTVYGLGVLAGRPEALSSLFALKGRPDSVAIAVLVADADQALALADDADGALARLAEVFWPGPLTVVARRVAGLDYGLGGDPDSIGLRCPADDVVRRLAAELGPLAVTSANRHGEPPITDAAALAATFPGVTVLDGGRRAAAPSTVVSVLGDAPEVLRVGPLAGEELARVIRGGSVRD